MPLRLLMPQFGEIMESGIVARWLVPDRTAVTAGQPLYEVETSKVQMTVEAPAAGVLRQRVAEGAEVPVGTEVAVLLLPGDESTPP
jgi:pyruvate/2-oxoglutarate dehydrogenase complex dihydrolipoamide acyltransferase (E2) component